MITYLYGMRLRPFSIACQPMDGLIERQDDFTGRYYDVLVYSRQLTAQECSDYDLDFIGMNWEAAISHPERWK